MGPGTERILEAIDRADFDEREREFTKEIQALVRLTAAKKTYYAHLTEKLHESLVNGQGLS